MPAQYCVYNATDHHYELTSHRAHRNWDLDHKQAYSLSLPLKAGIDLKYKVKHEGVAIASFWLTPTGMVKAIHNYGEHHFVISNTDLYNGRLLLEEMGSCLVNPNNRLPVILITSRDKHVVV
jgi:hypothetical protein